MNLKKWLSDITKLLNKINLKNNKTGNLIIIFLLGILMIITVSFFKTPDNKSVNTTAEVKKMNTTDKSAVTSDASTSDGSQYEKSMEDKLKNTLEKIDGVGKVEVMINFESGEEQVPAVNINNSTNTTSEKDNEGGIRNTTQDNKGSTVVVTNDGDKSQPLIVKTYKPKASGICIVAEGAENKVTELRISKAVTDLFDITDDKVNVYPMKK